MQPEVAAWEQELEANLRGLATSVPESAELAAEVRARLVDRKALGQPSLRDRFAPVFAATDPDALIAAFLRHPTYAEWTEFPGTTPGRCLEEAFAAFAAELDLVPASVLARCRYEALIKALAVDPDPAFAIPEAVCGERGRRWLIDRGVLYAAVGERVIIGPIPASAAALLRGEAGPEPVAAKLQALGLLGSQRPRVETESAGLGSEPRRQQRTGAYAASGRGR